VRKLDLIEELVFCSMSIDSLSTSKGMSAFASMKERVRTFLSEYFGVQASLERRDFCARVSSRVRPLRRCSRGRRRRRFSQSQTRKASVLAAENSHERRWYLRERTSRVRVRVGVLRKKEKGRDW
jgi:hypothetical protein